MCNYGSRKLSLFLFSFILLFSLSFPAPVQADSTTIPWLSGSFGNFAGLFSVSGTWQDYQWNLVLSPNLPDMAVTWSCDANYCEGWGGGPYTGGTAYGEIWSLSLNSLLYTFTGDILPGGGFREAGQCIPSDACPSYTYDQYYVNFRGFWSNGWSTVGMDYATDFESSWNGSHESDVLGWFSLTTSTPEPTTLTLLAAGIIGLAMRRLPHDFSLTKLKHR